MSERPILFSGPMVRAILDGRKTQTRRVIEADIKFVANGIPYGFSLAIPCPYGKPGDQLWVRETFAAIGKRVFYRADHDSADWAGMSGIYGFVTRPSIFMPRAVSRITLEIESVRVERLKDISADDVAAEGVTPHCNEDHLTHHVACPIEAYERIWNSINGKKHPWASYPWVWVITFRREVMPNA